MNYARWGKTQSWCGTVYGHKKTGTRLHLWLRWTLFTNSSTADRVQLQSHLYKTQSRTTDLSTSSSEPQIIFPSGQSKHDLGKKKTGTKWKNGKKKDLSKSSKQIIKKCIKYNFIFYVKTHSEMFKITFDIIHLHLISTNKIYNKNLIACENHWCATAWAAVWWAAGLALTSLAIAPPPRWLGLGQS